ncbi:hypothetical protein B0H17DRAFT_1103524 [Mycena rosella]|uniref:F-box domain-containing protein n=1 Tax=Mycena rosella TaxID=1033263 RepID=A0AAD7CDP0_MYCRO|nr:hypothetical protein B0H17DRAFT_1103524 [Mycena rosella]
MTELSVPTYPPPPLSVETLVALKNNPAPASEALVARPWLLGAEAELTRINHEIQRLESLRSTLLPPLEVYRVALAPHKLLPVDVLREIFHRATPPTADLNTTAGGKPDMHLIICRVCSLWRSVALDMPALWSNFRVEMDFDSEGYPPDLKLSNVLNTWLVHSGQHPLTLTIVNASYPSATRLITRYSHRIRSLSLDHVQSFATLQPGSLDLLETLRIESEEDYGEAGLRPNSLSVLRTATRLHSVTLSKIEDIAYLESVGIPWDQLTELHINEASVRPSQYYHILRHCAALVSARIDIYDDDDPASQQITLPGLRKLILTGNSLPSYAGFLHNFALPSLVNLSLCRGADSPGDDTDDGADPSKSFAAPTFPALQRLVIDDDHQVSQARKAEIMSWLRACPSAIAVGIPDSDISNLMLMEIAEGSLLPNVEMLVILVAETPTLIATLQRRQQSTHHSTLTEVGLLHHAWLSTSDDMDALRTLMTLGVFLGSYSGRRVRRGEIEKSARLASETGTGAFAPREVYMEALQRANSERSGLLAFLVSYNKKSPQIISRVQCSSFEDRRPVITQETFSSY